ncbi:WD40-repeat-containing domain protein [Dioszegia hungarica]|uniref:WD40-repeat-containing domain protein n=1 Tax=Dioszegia hungarica TaxID=4972 RepID=A0AA38HBK7_9TREE|nr:WD40-repeat-containing domain protein [Dioszegia hungarica]KAI9635934.1 WD40-repeat-containing domain protein [Dioszegia hungarica]
MTRTSHKAHPTPAFPVYCLDWADDEVVIMGGGGGASRSGIENKLKLAKVSKDARNVKYINELKLSSEEDAPMTIAVDRESKQLITGINASSSSIQAGKNEQCRVYSYAENSLAFSKGKQTISAAWSDDYPYQKHTSLSPNAKYLAVGSTDDSVSVLTFPALETVKIVKLEAEVVDLDWGGEGGAWLAITTTSSLFLYHLVGSGESSSLELKQTIYPPSIDITKVMFRAARFSPTSAAQPKIHAVLNSAPPARSAKGRPRKAWICTFGLVAGPSAAAVTTAEKATGTPVKDGQAGEKEGDELGRWDVLVRREVAGKPVTVFDVSADGKLLSYGCSDLSIGMLDAATLNPLLKILHAHNFPPTALKFNPSATLLISASADNTLRAIVVPASFAGVSPVLIALLVLLLAIIAGAVMRR